MVESVDSEDPWAIFIEEAYEEYHASIDPDIHPMDEWILLKDLVKMTVEELEGETNPQLEQSIIHEMWNIIHPDEHWVHVTCAMVSPNIRIQNYRVMSPIRKFILNRIC